MLGIVDFPAVTYFLSISSCSPSHPIIPLDPGCSTQGDEVAEETLAAADLQHLFPGICSDGEHTLPDVVADVEAPVLPATDVSVDIPRVSPLALVLWRISTLTPL